MNPMTVDATLVRLAVLAGLPIGQSLGMALTTPIGGNRDLHQLLRVVHQQGTVASFASDPGQLKPAGSFIIPGGVAGKTFVRLFRLLQIYLKSRVDHSLGVTAV